MTTTTKAPKTIGPNLIEMTIREQAASAWANQAAEERRKAERAARNLAQRIFGNVPVEFDDFIPEDFAQRHQYEPRHLCTFNIEGLEFNYVAVSRTRDREHAEFLQLIDHCNCERGPRILAAVENLADIGRVHQWDYSDKKCADCRDDEAKAKKAA